MFRALTTLFTFSTLLGKSTEASTIYPTFSLGNNVDGVSSSVFNGESSGDQSGTFVANVGDINGDGKTDFAIGAPYALSTAGKVYVVFGSDTGFNAANAAVDLSTLDGNNGFVILGETSGDAIGFSLAGGGDFNGDGMKDLVVAASNVDKIYLIYGTRAGFNATFPLATLGTKGFVFRGRSGENTGYSITMVDFNGDGFSDLVFGTLYAFSANGLVGVVFGTNTTVPGNVSALNGANGFIIPGIFFGGQSGTSLTAGDMNGDGLIDIAFGAPLASPSGKGNAGVVTVIFGKNKSFSASLNVSLLNGTDGFSVEGVSQGDNLGSALSMGDIDADGLSDLFMGASYASPHGKIRAGSVFGLRGRRYFNATVDLSKLNGTDGYRVNGALAGDGLGSSLSAADIDGDGLSDGVFSAPGASPNVLLPKAGSAFVVFGTNASVVPVLELPGSNDKVLRIDGGSPSPYANSFCVATADIRGDGYGLSAVIIGVNLDSPGNAFNGGSTYVVYGDSIQLSNNQLTIPAGGSHILTPSDLNVSVPNNPGYTQYTITGIQHVQFEYTDQPGVPITSFSGQDIITGRVNVTHDDNELAPSYFATALHTFAGTTASPANITFINQLPVLANNSFIINQGQTIQINPTMLAAVDPNNAQNNAEIVISFLGSSNGYPSPPSFFQSQLLAGGAYFTHDGSLNRPQCSVSFGRGGVTMGPTPCVFDFDTTPVWVQNHFDICQGQNKVVTPNMLSAIHPGANSSDTLVVSVNNVQYGYFERVNAPGVAILNFTQAEIKNSSIQFVHDGSPNPPSFEATVSDGRITTPLNPAVYFTNAPVITSNGLTLNQGQPVVLNSNMLNAVNPNLNSRSEDLVFTVSSVVGGGFIKGNQNITQFNQSQVTANEIVFRSDGSPNAPSYDVVVANQCSQTQPSGANVKFNSAPEITINELTITKQGQPAFVTTGQLDATDKETPADDLSFNVSVMQGGCFKTIGLEQCIDLFPRQAVRAGTILFAPDGSGLLPVYNVSVTDGVLWDGPRQALVTLNTPSVTVVNTPATNTATNYTGAIVGSVVGLGALVLAAFGGNWWFKKRANDQFKKLLLEQGASEADKTFKQEVVYPIANKIFDAINTAGCLRQRTETDNNLYMIAITKIVSELQAKNANLDFKTMDPGDKEAFLNEIARQTRQHSLPQHKRCSLGSCARFFRAEATPQEIEAAAGYIAQDAFNWQNRRKRGPSTKNTSSGIEPIELKVLSDFPGKAANEDISGGPQLTWQRDMQREQKGLGEQLAALGARVGKLEEGQLPKRQSVRT